MENTISWFPGHMQRTTRKIKEIIKEIDLIIEIVDARAPNLSSNAFLLNEISNNKSILKIALKSDLALFDKNIFSGSIFEKNLRKKIINRIIEMMQEKITRKIKKGLINPKVYVLVVGLPNVGKSSFINYMASKKQLNTANVPGVTKKKQWLTINKQIEMLDTPGVFPKKIEKFNDLAILALIKTIRWEICPKDEIIKWAFDFYQEKYPIEFSQYYNIESTSFLLFLDDFCKMRKILLASNKYDYEKALEILYKDFTSGKICKVNYE